MRYSMFLLTAWLCGAGALTAWGADPLGVAGGLGGGVSAAGGGPGAGAASQNRAAIRLRGADDAATRRHVGANFDSRIGADARGGAAGRQDVRVGADARVAAKAQRRTDSQPQPQPTRRPEPAEQRPHDPRMHAALRADLTLAGRLAEIDRLRDIALANADTQMLMRADALEREARAQHQHQIRAWSERGGEQGQAMRIEHSQAFNAEGQHAPPAWGVRRDGELPPPDHFRNEVREPIKNRPRGEGQWDGTADAEAGDDELQGDGQLTIEGQLSRDGRRLPDPRQRVQGEVRDARASARNRTERSLPRQASFEGEATFEGSAER